jgi:predicted metalloprotease with PDZ domain
VAVEDASLNTWIDPTYVDRYIYYDKGAALGLLLDIEIREATGNQSSLDDVMRRLYTDHYEQGNGFSTDDFVGYLAEYLGREAAEDFYRRYVDGREPLPYQETLERAGWSYVADTIVEPFFGVQLGQTRDRRMMVRQVVPGSSAAQAGLQPRDFLEWVGEVEVRDARWSEAFYDIYGDAVGEEITIVYRRGEEEIRMPTTVRTRTRYTHRLEADPNAGPEALELKRAILQGSTAGS